MHSPSFIQRLTVAISPLFLLVAASEPNCRAVPGTPSWPSDSAWTALNNSISGALIKSVPPGGVCHPGQPNYNSNVSCAAVEELWTTSWAFHSDDPVSVAENTWSNDTCLPYPEYPCSDLGYPVYVINASTPQHVQAGVNFARDNNVRLVVKTSGHDFRGRSIAPYSLSIWLHNLQGLAYHDSFLPNGSDCSGKNASEIYNGPAITVAAGENHGAAFAFADQHGLMIHVAGGATVGVGGYITGGGHSVISFQKGLAADAVLEMSVVLSCGNIVIANAYQNTDLFWALRGGGGSTLGVVLSFTIKAFPSEPLTMYILDFGSPTFNESAFWSAVGYMASQFPSLSDSGVMCYSNQYPANATFPAYFNGIFLALNKSIEQTAAIMDPVAAQINSTFLPDVISLVMGVQEFPSYYNWWINSQDASSPIGADIAIGSRLLDQKALSHPDLADYLRNGSSQGGLQMNLVGGPGTQTFPDDFNALTPGWRKAYVHAITGVGWAPLDVQSRAQQFEDLTYAYTAALRALAPDTGSYLNEANSYEPDFQDAFWGTNYPRLLAIKREIDPDDVFWCQGCAGSERWQQIGDTLCAV